MTPLPTVDDARILEIPDHRDATGALLVFEAGKQVPFPIARVFTVHAPAASQRGRHAHRQCSQLMVCLEGVIDVVCDDGERRRTIRLDKPADGLLVPPGIWAEQNYLAPGNILMILCDRGYEPADYLRNRDEFLAFRGINV